MGATFHTRPELTAERREFYERLDRKSAAPLWEVLGEIVRSASKRQFVREVARYVPAVAPADVVPAAAGVRAQAIDRDGSLVDDFRLATNGSVTWVRNAPSPAATSSLAIAEELVSHATGG